MKPRWLIVTVLVGSICLVQWWPAPGDRLDEPALAPRPTLSQAQPVPVPLAALPQDHQPPEQRAVTLDTNHLPLAQFDSDIQQQPYPLDLAALEQLTAQGRITLPHPAGGLLELELRAVETRTNHELLHVRITGSANLMGQITRTGNGFFATLPTKRGVYSLENHGVTTYIVNQQELDQRLLPGLSDARAQPLA